MTLGPVVTARELRAGMQETLEEWLPSILVELARRAGWVEEDQDPLDVITPPRSWKRLPSFRALTADQSPAVVVTSTGLNGQPKRDGEGLWAATWALHGFVVVRGATYEDTADRVGLYLAAIRAAVLQQGIAGVQTRKPRWLGEAYDELDTDAARSIGAGVVSFEVTAGDAVADLAGPAVPPEAPDYTFPADPEIETAAVTVEQL